MVKASLNLIAIVVFTVIATGCSSTKLIKQEEDLQLYKHATLVMSNNANIDVKSIYTREDSIFAFDYYKNNHLKFHKSDIKKIVMTDRSKGAKHGFLIAGSVGLLYGVGYGLASDVDDPLAHPVAAGGITGLLGGCVGALTGLVIGSKTTYQFDNNDSRIITEKFVSSIPKTVTSLPKPDDPKSGGTNEELTVPNQTFKSNRQRRSWYLYGEYGYGFGNLLADENASQSADNNRSGSGISVIFEAGIRAKQSLLLGIRAGGFGEDKVTDDTTNGRGIARFHVIATYFPGNKNFFTRAGLGYSLYEYSSKNDDEVFYEKQKHGFGGQLGIGYAIWLTRNFNLVIGGEISGHLFENEPSPIWAQITLGIMWY